MTRKSSAITVAALAALVVLSVLFWAGNPVDSRTVIAALASGIALGSVYAVAATGLVVTYTTSGVFNFSQGAVGMFMAFLYWELHISQGWPTIPALIVVVGIAAPLAGIFLYRVIMRHLVDVDLVVQLMVTVGLMLALMGIAGTIWKTQTYRSLPFFFGNQSGFHLAGSFILWHRAAAVIVGVLVAVGFRLLLFYTRIGAAMRAVVDNRELAALNGVRPARVGMISWALGSTLAAIAGILLAPEVLLDINSLTLLIVDAFAAAIFGRLRNLPLTFLGGMVLGLLNSYTLGFLNVSTKFHGHWVGLPAALPTIMLFFVLLALPEARLSLTRRVSPYIRKVRIPKLRDGAIAGVAILVAVLILDSFFGTTNQNRLLLALVTALILLSLVPLTGWAGQVNLATITFVGIGAFGMSLVSQTSGDPVGLLVAGGIAIPFGAVMALPALRLTGLYLALASLAFARMAELLLFPQPAVFGSTTPNFAPLSIFGWHASTSARLSIVAVVAFTILGTALIAYRRSRFGRRLIAVRDSPAAAATLGINIRLTKLTVYCVSAGLAGIAGGFLALQQQTVSEQDFTSLNGLQYPLLLVIGGVAMVSGAFAGGVFAVMLLVIQSAFHFSWLQSLETIGPGLAALGMVRNPSGAAAAFASDMAWMLPWNKDARAAHKAHRPMDPLVLGFDEPYDRTSLATLEDVLCLIPEARIEPRAAERLLSTSSPGGQ